MRSARSASAFLSCILLATLAAACGDDDAESRDASGDDDDDAAADATPPSSDGDVGADASLADLLVRLNAIPGMTATEEVTDLEGYRFFFLGYDQPVDHDNPGGQRFSQRATLLSRDEQGPMVLFTSGYNLSTQGGRTEITRLALANQLSVEHRYFAPSQPQDPTDWQYDTIEQAAADLHRLRVALDGIYGGPWVNTGGSKGGMTALFSRRFYPDDFTATVPYVAPISIAGPDSRYVDFVAQAGDDPDCNAALLALQRRALGRRDEMVALMASMGAANGFTWDRLGIDKAFEHTIMESDFVFWQYGNASLCPTIPGADATAQEDFDLVEATTGFENYDDDFIGYYEAYYYQAGTQFGWPANNEPAMGDLVVYPGTDEPASYGPIGATMTYDPLAMADILDWVATDGERLMFIYGENDPWSAGMVDLGDAQDSYRYVQPAGNHGSRILRLASADETAALAKLSEWMGVTLVPPSMIAPVSGPTAERDPRDDGPRRRW